MINNTHPRFKAKAVCSGRFHGIRGLGTEVVRRSERLAAELGCTHAVAPVSGTFEDFFLSIISI